MEENPGTPPSALLERLEKMLQAEIILLPWDVNEEFGHADGIVRFVDSDTVIMTNYSQFDKKMADTTDLIKHEGCLNCATWTINSNPCAEEVQLS